MNLHEIISNVIAGLTFVVLTATLIAVAWYTCITHRIAESNRELAETTKDSSERQLRAYVGFLGGGIQLITEREAPSPTGPGDAFGYDNPQGKITGYRLQAHVEIKNAGQTPAYDVTFSVAKPVLLDKDAEPPDDGLKPVKDRMVKFILSPEQQDQLHSPGTDVFGASDLSDLIEGKKKVYIWGSVDYKDAFGEDRYFRFYSLNGGRVIRDGKLIDAWAITAQRRGYEAN